MPSNAKAKEAAKEVVPIRADSHAHWRASSNREFFFESAVLSADAGVATDAPAELQAALDRCAPLFAAGSETFVGVSSAADKYELASRVLGVKLNPQIEAQFRSGPPAGPERIAVLANVLDEGTLAALLCTLGAVPSVTRLKLWHNALTPVGWAMLARLLPGTSVLSLECAGQEAVVSTPTSSAAAPNREAQPEGERGGLGEADQADAREPDGLDGEGYELVRMPSHASAAGSEAGTGQAETNAGGQLAGGGGGAAAGAEGESGRNAGDAEVSAPEDGSAAADGARLWPEDRLGALLACAPSLAVLSARHCSLPPGLALCSALARHKALQALDLSGTPLGDSGVLALARALSSNRCLEALGLTAVRAADGAASAIAALLAPLRPASEAELAAFTAAVAAGKAQPAADGAGAKKPTQAKAASGGGGLPKPPAPGSKERCPILTALLQPQADDPYSGPEMVLLPPAAAEREEGAVQHWAVGNGALKWISLAHNSISHAGKNELYEACAANSTCHTLELGGNPCSHGLGASLRFADVQLLAAVWREVRTRHAGALVEPAGGGGKGASGKKAAASSLSKRAGGKQASVPAASAAHHAEGAPGAPSALSTSFLLRVFAARPELLEPCTSFRDAADLSVAPGLLRMAAAVDELLAAVLGNLAVAPDRVSATLLAAAHRLEAYGVDLADEANVVAASEALEASWAAELEALDAAVLAQLPGAAPVGVAAAGMPQGATAQSRVLGAVKALWVEVLDARPRKVGPAPCAQTNGDKDVLSS